VTSPALPSTDAVSVSASTRTTVTLLAIASFFSGAALRICDGLLPRLASDFAISAGTAGSVVLTFALAYGVSQLVFGPLGDRYGKARVINFALFGCAGGALACALAPGFDALLRLRILWGIAAGASSRWRLPGSATPCPMNSGRPRWRACCWEPSPA
jgi:predicted MFS family arabinose efflux permease